MCNCFTAKVLVNNFKVEKSENLDNAFYVFYVFWHDTSKNVKSRVFWIFKKNVKTYSRTMSGIVSVTVSLVVRQFIGRHSVAKGRLTMSDVQQPQWLSECKTHQTIESWDDSWTLSVTEVSRHGSTSCSVQLLDLIHFSLFIFSVGVYSFQCKLKTHVFTLCFNDWLSVVIYFTNIVMRFQFYGEQGGHNT